MLNHFADRPGYTMTSANLLVLCLCVGGAFILAGHGVMGQCGADETLIFNITACVADGMGTVVCTPLLTEFTGRFVAGGTFGADQCMVGVGSNGMIAVTGLMPNQMCMALIVTCVDNPTTTTTTTTAATVDSPESAESGVGGASSRR